MNVGANGISGAAAASADDDTEYNFPFTARAGKRYALSLAYDTDYTLYDSETLLAFGQYPDYRVYIG